MVCNSKAASRRAKSSEIYESGTLVTEIRGAVALKCLKSCSGHPMHVSQNCTSNDYHDAKRTEVWDSRTLVHRIWDIWNWASFVSIRYMYFVFILCLTKTLSAFKCHLIYMFVRHKINWGLCDKSPGKRIGPWASCHVCLPLLFLKGTIYTQVNRSLDHLLKSACPSQSTIVYQLNFTQKLGSPWSSVLVLRHKE